MINCTKFALKRPVTVLLALVTLVFFGMQSVFGSKIELTPEMELPVMLIATVYPGASPEDANELIGKKVEEAVASLSGISVVQYNYGTDMDTAYLDL